MTMSTRVFKDRVINVFLGLTKKLKRSNILLSAISLLVATGLSFFFVDEPSLQNGVIPTAYMKCIRVRIKNNVVHEVGKIGHHKQQIIEFYDQSHKKHHQNQDRENIRKSTNSLKNVISVRVFNMTLPSLNFVGHPSPFRSCSSNSPNYTWSLLCEWDYEQVKNNVEKAGVESYSMTGPASDFMDSLQLSLTTSSVSQMCSELKKLQCHVLSPPKIYVFFNMINVTSIFHFFMYIRKKIFYAIIVLLFCL